uniref:HTH CENPB-type domain-containing protein n=1 Tax=Stomoxys calcitrans TaxID=35570 RepID=A0A1I8PHF3_STOCA
MPLNVDSQEQKNNRAKITIAMKHKIIEKHKQGVGVGHLARTFNLTKSTISTILKNKYKLKDANASKGVSRISSQRSRILDDVEKLLLIWINEKQMQGDSISQNIICEKAKSIFADLVERTPGSSAVREEVFKASKGWVENFKKRTGIHEIIFLAIQMGLEVDIDELVAEHSEELTTEELMDLQCALQQEDVEENLSTEEVTEEQ